MPDSRESLALIADAGLAESLFSSSISIFTLIPEFFLRLPSFLL
jgi:hypothetical protein